MSLVRRRILIRIVRLFLSTWLVQAPDQDRPAELIELGRQQVFERERQRHLTRRGHVLQVLTASDQVEWPRPYTGQEPSVRRTPVPITGQPVSEIVIEQREPR